MYVAYAGGSRWIAKKRVGKSARKFLPRGRRLDITSMTTVRRSVGNFRSFRERRSWLLPVARSIEWGTSQSLFKTCVNSYLDISRVVLETSKPYGKLFTRICKPVTIKKKDTISLRSITRGEKMSIPSPLVKIDASYHTSQ